MISFPSLSLSSLIVMLVCVSGMPRGLETYSLCAAFFLSATFYFVSNILLIQVQERMRSISQQFVFTRIPLLEGQVFTFYYEGIINNIIYGELPDPEEEKLFLNDAADKSIPADLKFSGIAFHYKDHADLLCV